MSELAFNYTGQRFSLPGEAMYWRVRRIRDGHRGRLDVVLSAAGLPLTLPIDAGIEELRVAVGDVVGRYRLDALDAAQMPLSDVEAAYVSVPMPRSIPDAEECAANRDEPSANLRNAAPPVPWTPAATVTAPFGTWPALPMPVAMTGTEYLLAEALRGQVQMFQMVTAALSNQTASTSSGASQMMSAAAELVRAADGAAMSHRLPPPPAPPSTTPAGPAPTMPPIVFAAPGSLTARNASGSRTDDWDGEDPDGDDNSDADDRGDDGDDDAGGEADMFAKMMTLADKVQGVLAPVADVARLVMGGMGAGVRNAAPDEGAGDEGGDEQPVEPFAAPDVAHLRASHILLVAHELGPDGSLFRRLLMAMEPGDRQTWTDRLCSMPFEDAVADAAAKLERFKRRHAVRRAEQNRGPGVDQADRGVSRDDGNSGVETEEGGGEGVQVAREEASNDRDESGEGGDIASGPDAADDSDRDDDPGTNDESDDVPAVEPTSAATTPATVPAPSPAAVQARMMEIAKHLRVPEILRAQKLVAQIGGAERDVWIAKLMTISPAEAAHVIRTELASRGH